MDEKKLRENFASNLLKLRKSKKWNQQDLADKLSYSDKAISKWENGDTIPDVFTMYCIASLFNISIDQLIFEKKVVKAANKTKRRLLITFISTGLCFLLATVIYFALTLCHIPNAYMSYLFAVAAGAIVLIVLTKLWFKKIWTIVAVDLLVIMVSLIIMIFMSFNYFWIILIAATLVMLLLDILLEVIN